MSNKKKFQNRRIVRYFKPVNGYIVLKFYEIEKIPLISLRNMDDSSHCEASFMYFYNILSEETSESLDEGSIDLLLYEKTCNEITDKLFLTIGYTTTTDTNIIKIDNQDCNHLLYFWSTDIAWSFHYYLSINDNGNPMVVSRAYLEEEIASFQKQSVPPF